MITPGFEDVWPDVERRLRALLYRRGLDQPSADDVVQEVALRVLAHGVTYESAADLLRWAAPVACRLHVDLLRHRARITDPEGAVDRASRDDVAGEVADRLELQRALRAIATLRPADREAIMEAVAAEPAVPRNRQEAVRLAVRRHRARSRLAVVLEQLAGWVAGWWGGLRAIARYRRGPVAAAVVPAAVVLPLMVALAPFRPATAPPVPVPAVAAPAAAPHVTSVADASVATRGVLAAVAPRRAVPAARPAAPDAATSPVRIEATRKRTEVGVAGPRGLGARAGREPRTAEDVSMLCLNDLPVFQQVCVL